MAQSPLHKAVFRTMWLLARLSAAILRSTTSCGCDVSRSLIGCHKLHGHCDEKNDHAISLIRKHNALAGDICRGLSDVLHSAKIAPVIFVSAESKNPLSLTSYAKVAVDDRESALFGHPFEEARRNYMNARKRQRLRICH